VKRALVMLVAVALVAGCGGDDTAETSAEGRTKLVVGVIPIADVAPLYLGMEKGFFRDERLDVEPRPIQGGAAAVPSVVANEFQIAFGNSISLLQAQQRNLKLRIVTEGVQAGKSDKDSTNGMMVPKGSDVREPSDLEGQTIAVNTLNNLGEVTVKASLEKQGADVSDLKFVEVPFPEMNTALGRNSVAAAWHVEPFISQLLGEGGRKLFDPFVETHPRLTPAQYFGAAKFLDANPEVAERFRRAMNKSLDYARTHEAEVRKLIPEFSEIPAPVAQKIPLPYWTSDLNEDSVRELATLAEKYGVLEGEVDVDAILPKQ
jgi:NitT/TauT family transport system substrate-binding protein